MNEQNTQGVFERDPFRLFFPLGLAYGLWAVLVWIFFGMGLTQSYPSALHTNLILGGFEVSFVVGFLMTAIPRFTKTHFAQRSEIWVASVLLLLPGIFAVCGTVSYTVSTSLAVFIFLLIFAYRRINKRAVNPPDTFVFVGAALLLGCLAQVIRVLSQMNFIDLSIADQISRSLLNHGFMLGLVLGIGGRLFPGILGWSEIVTSQKSRYERPLAFGRVVSPLVWALLAGFLVSFPLEIENHMLGRLLRAGIVFVLALTHWRIHKFPQNRAIHSWSIWISSWCMVGGVFCYALMPSLVLEAEHVVFIGGYSLLTLMVAGRVTLAHGAPGNLEFEKKSWPYLLVTVPLLLAMFIRVFANTTPQSYIHHLAYAAAVWICGLVIWSVIFLPKMLKI